MSKVEEYLEAVKGLSGLRSAAVGELNGLTLRQKVELWSTNDMSWLGTEPDGGFLYGAFPGGGWGHALTSVIHAERHQTIEVSRIIECMFEGWWDEGRTNEENEESALVALETSDAAGCKLLRVLLEKNIYAFEFDW